MIYHLVYLIYVIEFNFVNPNFLLCPLWSHLGYNKMALLKKPSLKQLRIKSLWRGYHLKQKYFFAIRVLSCNELYLPTKHWMRPFNRLVDPVALEIHVSLVFCFTSAVKDVILLTFCHIVMWACYYYWYLLDNVSFNIMTH